MDAASIINMCFVDLFCFFTPAGGRLNGSRSGALRAKLSVHHLLSLHLKLLLMLLLLLLDKMRVQFGSARDSDDGSAEVADRVLSHGRQRRRLLASLLLRAPVKI